MFKVIRGEAGSDDERRAEVRIYDEIGWTWDGSGVTAKAFVEELDALDVDEITLRVNSPGGSVFDGFAIENALRRHRATVTAHVDGLAASIATVIVLAADRVLMAPNAHWMIHDPWTFAIGNADELRKSADLLDKLGGTLLDTYARHADAGRDEIAEWMGEEKWFTASEAVAIGFADAIDGDDADLAAVAKFEAIAGGRFRNVPDRIAAAGGGGSRSDAAAAAEQAHRFAFEQSAALLAAGDPDETNRPGMVTATTIEQVDERALAAFLR